MQMEIERKWLVPCVPQHALRGSARNPKNPMQYITQGYLTVDKNSPTVRVRVIHFKDEAGIDNYEGRLTIKGKRQQDRLGKPEFEYPIPYEDAKGLLLECGTHTIAKLRYTLPLVQPNEIELNIEVDVFVGALHGLCVAEIEIPSENYRIKNLPSWFGDEVTTDKRYSNKRLSIAQRIPE